MSAVKHTPGPWKRVEDQNHNRGCNLNGQPYYRQIIMGPDCYTVAAGDMAEQDANLIAAAPDLLAALDQAHLEIIKLLNEGDFKRRVVLDLGYIVDAIAKAKGEL